MSDIFTSANNTLNACGLRCPDSIMILRKTMRCIPEGHTLLVITDDPATIRDIPSFCLFMKHTLLAYTIEQLPYQYLLCKKIVAI